MSSQNPSVAQISRIFNNLSYDPVLDSDSTVKAWVAKQNKGVLSHFIDGEFVTASQDELNSTFEIKNPYSGDVLAKSLDCTPSRLSQAVESSKSSFESWKKLDQVQRGRIVYNIARNVQKNLQILVACESVNSGRTSREVKDLDLTSVVKALYYYSGSVGLSDSQLSNYDPLGVVAICGYHDSSLLSLVNKIAPAIVAGNTCVVIPHKLTPLSAFMFLDICIQSGVPAGVINLVLSNNDQIYNWISNDARIGGISFDGKSSIGQNVLIPQSAVYPHKQVVVSLEGKSSLVVYESADLDSAIETIVDGCFYSNGQHRYSLNKVFVQEPVLNELSQRLEERFKKIRVGNHMDKCNDYSLLIDSNDLKSFNEQLNNQTSLFGAQVKQFNESITDSAKAKLIVPPTIIKNVALGSDLNLNEVNGPYVMIIPFRTVKESVELINTSKYGSSVCLYSQNISLVMEVAYLVNVGTCWINSFPIEKGVQTRKQSGNYQLNGFRSLRNFLKPKYDHLDQLVVGDLEATSKRIKQFGALDATPTLPSAHNLAEEKTYKLYVGGKQARADTQSSRIVFNHKNEPHCLVADASRKDVRNAVEAANSAYSGWWKRSNFNKAQIIYYFGENFTARSQELSAKLALSTGKSKAECDQEIKLCSDVIFKFASLCDKYVGRLNDTTDYGYLMEVSEPLGCVAIICGNSSLLSFVFHLMGAIAYGNTAIIVPNEKSPLPALDLYEIFDTSDMPGGVVNILTGGKHHLAKYLCEHQQVNAVWYMYDETIQSDVNELTAVQFIKQTSSFNLKRTWLIPSNLSLADQTLVAQHSNELSLQATQTKSINIPIGTIFSN